MTVRSKSKSQKVHVCQDKLQRATRKLAGELTLAAKVESNSICNETKFSDLEIKLWKSNSDKLEKLMAQLKIKYDGSNYSEKIQILTVVSKIWTQKEIIGFFDCTKYAVRKSVNLSDSEGILATPKRKLRSGITDTTKSKVIMMYNDDEYSRIMPGAKDKVSLGKKTYAQKRLILCTLKELFHFFRTEYSNPDDKIGLTKFCTLRPKYCVLPGSSGTHNVCVCCIHQNALLLAEACGTTYKDLMAMLVCNLSDKMCMVHRCSTCPGTRALKMYLTQIFDDRDYDDLVQFQQWQNTDRAQLDNLSLNVPDFIDLVVEKIDKLTSHSFIAKEQSKYLKQRKQNMRNHECVVLADFAENYQFMVQDEIQSCHWNKDYCTIHPITLYINDGSIKSKCFSLCFISDDLNHDTSFVNCLQQLLAKYISDNFQNITELEYFSDGCAGQYKNFKNFLNLTYHEHDFNIKATWSFFATSHGKSPCDGIGGTVKRKLRMESLTRTSNNQILTCKSAYEFCQSSIKGITFFFLSKDDVQNKRLQLETRYTKGNTVPGTRSYHHFASSGIGNIQFKRISNDSVFCGNHNFFFSKANYTVHDLPVMTYVACSYDDLWWIGFVENISQDEGDIKIQFLHPNGPSNNFFWPPREHYCWVPCSNVLLKIKAPITSNGRLYKMDECDTEKVQSIVSNL